MTLPRHRSDAVWFSPFSSTGLLFFGSMTFSTDLDKNSHNNKESHGPQYGHPPLLCQELLDRVDDVPGQQQLSDITEGTGWVYLTADVKHVTIALEVVTRRPRERIGLRQIRDIPREAARVVDQTTEAAQVGVLPPRPRALTGQVTPGQTHRGRALAQIADLSVCACGPIWFRG